VSGKRIPDTAIALQLLLSGEISSRRVFYSPETEPTSTRYNGSGICCTATQNNALFPSHAKAGLDEKIGRNERNALFAQHLLGQL
jgi:hypothetical protein